MPKDLVMDRIQFLLNGKQYSVGNDVTSGLSLLEFIRGRANLHGTKYMCLEAGCGACIVSVTKSPGTAPVAVNACIVTVPSCHNWEITTIEKVGNRLDGYHPIQKTLAKFNGTQCGHCTPGWVMAMYSLLENNKNLTMLEIEKSFASNICRCTGYRSILDALKSFAIDAPKTYDIDDIEDLQICNKKGDICGKNTCKDDDWCVITECDASNVQETILKDGKYWYRAREIIDIFDIFNKIRDNSYMLVTGNTAKGVYPIEEYPNILIDVSNVPALKGYKIDQNLIIGAGSTLSELTDIFENVSKGEDFKYLQTFKEHIDLVAHIPVKNLGSIAGNLMIKHQHNEFSSDVYLLLATVGAQLTILHSPRIKTVIQMDQFLKENMRKKLILNVILPPLNSDHKIFTYKIMPRAQNAHAIVNAGFLYKCTNGIVQLTKIVYGGLSTRFSRAESTEQFLKGKVLFINETLHVALNTLNSEMKVDENPPEPSAKYRRQLALSLFYKSILTLCPMNIVHSRFRSGSTKLNETRMVSKSQQVFDTNPSLYPLNQPIPKIEALIQSAGEASYADDQPIYPNEVFAAIVLSTVPTGKIVSIDPTRALKQPGAIAFYSARDIPGLNSFTPIEDPVGGLNEEVFAKKDIKYYNQPIGVIAAETKHIAEKIAKMVDVKYSDVKKPIIDVKKAKTDPSRNSLYFKEEATSIGTDICKKIKGSITTRGQYHFPMETLVCVSRPTEEGLEVFTSSQWIDAAQKMISRALNIQQNKVDVHLKRVGGAFGLKISRGTLSAVACCLVTQKLNKPCRIVTPLTYNTRALGKRFPCSSDYEVAVNSEGEIQHLNLTMFEDNGHAVNELTQIGLMDNYSNCYDKKRWDYSNINTITDTPKNTWCRAPGNYEGVAIVEGIMEHISYKLSLDPVEVRLANLDASSSSDVIEIINSIKSSSQYARRKNEVRRFNTENRWKKKGLRMSLMRWIHSVPRYFAVNLSVFSGDGSIIITHGGVEMGQGINTKAVQVCAYLLKVPLGKIQIKANNTIISPNCAVSGGSVTTQHIIIGVQKCCLELKKRLEPIKSQLNNPSWEELIKNAFEMNVDLQIHGFVGSESTQKYSIYGVSVAEVIVDILTGERQVLRVDLLEDVGQSISPEIDIGQIEGAYIMSLGSWLMEDLVYNVDNGELLTNRTWNYHVPQAMDIPQDFRVSFRANSYSTDIIFGSKATSEPPCCLAVAVPFALREAITSARLDNGIPTTSWFDIDGAYTLESVCLAGETKISDFKLN